MIDRRNFLRGVGVASAALGLAGCRSGEDSRSAPAPQPSPQRPSRPRALVQISLGGGIDTIFTTDPKERRQVATGLDVPYESDQILRTTTGGDFGPLWAPLAPLLGRFAILNGVHCSTVGHTQGRIQMLQLRRNFPAGPAAGFAATLGRVLRTTEPLDEVRLFPTDAVPPPGRSLLLPDTGAGPLSLLDHLSKIARSDQARSNVEAALNRQRATHAGNTLAADAVLDVMTKLRDLPLPAPPRLDLPAMPEAQLSATDISTHYCLRIRDALFALEHRLAPTVFINQLVYYFDSHADNTKTHTHANAILVPLLQYFLSELDRRKSPDGLPLSDEVGIVISTELGRFPILNDHAGKDHFPEIPVLLAGPGIRPGRYGETDDHMTATPISLVTGRPSSGKADTIPTLDDIGATVLRWYGVEDTRSLGYLGRDLPFLHT